MWFGTRAYMQEVVDPQVNPSYETSGRSEGTAYLGGGLGIDASVDAHREYYLDWGMLSRAQVRKITDYASGAYGTGLIYWIDPVAADQNVLPFSWSVPSVAGYDGVPLVGDDRPALSANGVLTQGYPAELATYTVTSASVSRTLFIPVPPGYTAWVGVHGGVSAAGFVMVTPYVGSTAGTPVYPTVLTTATTTRVNTSIDSVTGIELSIDVSGVVSEESFTLAGLIVQILADGVTPETGGFITGQGHSGCKFMGRPTLTPYDIELDLVSVTAKLGEVGEWL